MDIPHHQKGGYQSSVEKHGKDEEQVYQCLALKLRP